MRIELWLLSVSYCLRIEREADLVGTAIGMEKVQAQLVIVSDGASAGLRQTDHVAVFEPLVSGMYL